MGKRLFLNVLRNFNGMNLSQIFTSDVHSGHLVALIEIFEKQYGHSFVIGDSGGISACCFFSLFIPF
ncbi:MAG: hypothetical protein R6W90_09280, partial [Ignavibacteriaceae bacterium]